VVCDMSSYEWLPQSKDFDSIHPSLQRQAILNMVRGLYHAELTEPADDDRIHAGV